MAPRRLAVTPAKDARFQLKEIGAANDILGLGPAARQRKLMAQLRRIGGDTVISGDQRKPGTAPSPIIAPALGDPISLLPTAVIYPTFIVISG